MNQAPPVPPAAALVPPPACDAISTPRYVRGIGAPQGTGPAVEAGSRDPGSLGSPHLRSLQRRSGELGSRSKASFQLLGGVGGEQGRLGAPCLCSFQLGSLTGSPLSCHRCNGTGLTCTGPLVPCAPLQDACFTLTSETHIGGTPGKVDTFKGCTARTLCPPRSSTLSAGAGVRLRGGSVCCSHDGCNRGAVKLPLAPGVLTGRWCPGCAVEGPACKPKERVPCRDHEDQCLYVAGAIHVGSYNYSYALGGCATRSACVSAVGVYEVSGVFTEVISKAECSPAPSLHLSSTPAPTPTPTSTPTPTPTPTAPGEQ
ncbi:phospholipase A2 inhibitor and Ly6/PLAUR domain-containing protein-like [Alligator mississippiensis]|uniref:phospholipase A2 inhibitor and Ly6/PLAUR domain-containing protein-like n=1 Tax=Alligator mississippiensis TaxID=8496 RepID=UPI002877C396|nr:phospholipase A2 inhibitor and Ly6/PLAUR domain-containing protein-like [Alligator mississippiensis]